MGCELVILARTDALSAKLLDSNIDPIDHPYILGIYEGHRKPMTYPEAGLLAIDQQIHISKKE
jgi:isocitrate lyase